MRTNLLALACACAVAACTEQDPQPAGADASAPTNTSGALADMTGTPSSSTPLGPFSLAIPSLVANPSCSEQSPELCPIIPDAHASYAGGLNTSPEFAWSGVPEGTASFALSLTDVSYGQPHWVLWNIPRDLRGIPQDIPKASASPAFPAGASQANATFADGDGYFGPGAACNVYEFELFALSLERFEPSQPGFAAVVRSELQALGGAILGRSTLSLRADPEGTCTSPSASSSGSVDMPAATSAQPSTGQTTAASATDAGPTTTGASSGEPGAGGAGVGGAGGAGPGAAGSGGGDTGMGGDSSSDDEGTTVPPDATLVPAEGWTCGMPEGIPSPTLGELAFTITFDISAEREVGNTPYGYRRLLDVSGGTITGERLQGSVLPLGLEYELTLDNGVMEYQGINILETSDGSRIFVRSCGVAVDGESMPRIVPDFEATTSGSFAFLNTGKWVATRELTAGKLKLDVYDVSMVTAGEPLVELEKPAGVPAQPWECNMTSGQQGAEVLTENVTLGSSFSIPNAKYGSRNVIPITGGTTSGRVTGDILAGGADYQLAGSLDAWYTLAPDNGELILVRNCGAASGLIPWFEAAVDGEFDFLNSNTYLSSGPGVGAGGVTITFYERQ